MQISIEENIRPMAPPDAVLVFGAAGHIGGPLVEELMRIAPAMRLRLAASSADRLEALRGRFPQAEAVVANFLDPSSLDHAFRGMTGAFLVTSSFLDETAAMTNVVHAAKVAGGMRHIVRIMGDPPHVHGEEDVPVRLREWGTGTAVNHLRARRILDASGLPVTYLNIAAFLMDNIIRMMGPGLRGDRTLYMPFDRHMSWVDPADVGRAAAHVLARGDSFMLGKKYQLENGIDCLTFTELAALMSEVWGTSIRYSSKPEEWAASRFNIDEPDFSGEALHYWLDYMKWEQTADTVWRRTDIFETLFGFCAKSLAQWLGEHREAVLGSEEVSV